MSIFWRETDVLRIGDKTFFKGQKVRLIHNGFVSNTILIVSPSEPSLACRYEERGSIVCDLPHNQTNDTQFCSRWTAREPDELLIIDTYNALKMKGGVKMPRIFRIIFYAIMLFMLWKMLNPLVDLFISFLQYKVLKP